LAAANKDLADEAARTKAGFSSISDPSASSGLTMTVRVTAEDAAILKKKFPFLKEYSNAYIQTTQLDVLIRAETTAYKLRKLEKGAVLEDTLANNRDELLLTLISMVAGQDNCLDVLHPARFLPGASCSAKAIWLAAREVLGNTGHQALSSYDMGSVGLRRCVTNKGWSIIANPGNSQLKLKYFSMSSCSAKVLSTRGGQDKDEVSALIEELAEFKRPKGGNVLCAPMEQVHRGNQQFFRAD
jgi:hypothetical protein